MESIKWFDCWTIYSSDVRIGFKDFPLENSYQMHTANTKDNILSLLLSILFIVLNKWILIAKFSTAFFFIKMLHNWLVRKIIDLMDWITLSTK